MMTMEIALFVVTNVKHVKVSLTSVLNAQPIELKSQIVYAQTDGMMTVKMPNAKNAIINVNYVTRMDVPIVLKIDNKLHQNVHV